jgi:hypothetical protein
LKAAAPDKGSGPLAKDGSSCLPTPALSYKLQKNDLNDFEQASWTSNMNLKITSSDIEYIQAENALTEGTGYNQLAS